MKKSVILWLLIAILIAISATWLWQGVTYPHTIYEYIQTEDSVTKYEDRAGGIVVEAVPVWEPNNPPWVDFMRDWGIRIMLILGFSILYVAVSFGAKKEEGEGY